MNPVQTPPDPKAFVKLATFRKVLAWFRNQCGITAPGGSVAQLPTGGKAVRFSNASGRAPFTATNANGGIKIAAGVVGWAGRTIYFPEATYTGLKPGGVFLKCVVKFSATANAPGDPWDIIIDDGTPPVFVWRSVEHWVELGASGIGAHARITDTDATAAENIVTTEGTVYLPVATQQGNRLVQDFATAIDLYFIASGAVRMSERPGN